MSTGALNGAALNTHAVNGEAIRRLEGGGACRVSVQGALLGRRRLLGSGSARLGLAAAADPTLPVAGAGAAVVRGTAAASGTRRLHGAGSCRISIGTGAASRFGALTRAPVARTYVLLSELREFRIGPDPVEPTPSERRAFIVPRETRGR